MKKHLALMLILFMPHSAYAEYEELTALKKSSHLALLGYAKRLSSVDPKFEGVVNFGKALGAIEDVDTLNIDGITLENKNYWRAVLEMTPTDPSILFAHAHLHIVKGELSRAETYLLLGSLTMDDGFREEVATYQSLKFALEQRVTGDMEKGVQHHDKGEYAEALAAYDRVISQHPHSAWAFYEKGFSYLMMGKDDPEFEKKRVDMYAQCRQNDPFYIKAYQGSDPELIEKFMVLAKKVHPFASGEKRDLATFILYAEGCEEAGLFYVAAHARWRLAQVDGGNAKEHLTKFLDLLPKAGCKEADFFRGQFRLEEDDPPKPSPELE